VKLCLPCRRVWPSAARFCGRCGRSFGFRLCPKGHASPSVSSACLECGSKELSKTVSYVSLRPMTLAISMVVLLVVARVVATNFGGLVGAGIAILDATLRFVAGLGLADIAFAVFHVALLSAIPFVIGWIAFERGRTPSKCLRAYARLAGLAVRAAWWCVRGIGAMLAGNKRDRAKEDKPKPIDGKGGQGFEGRNEDEDEDE
jgi:hypothetical protein